MSGNEPTPEAHSYGVGSTARLQLRQEVADVRLHRLLRQEELLADLAVDEPVRDELQHFQLARGRLLLELAQRRSCERDHRAGASRRAPSSSRLEPAAVVAIAVEDLLTLSGVHGSDIGVRRMPL